MQQVFILFYIKNILKVPVFGIAIILTILHEAVKPCCKNLEGFIKVFNIKILYKTFKVYKMFSI